MSVEVGWSYNIYHVTGWGGGRYNTDHVMCCPVCLWGWGGGEIQHRSCDVLSCMSVVLGCGGVTTYTM